VINNKRTRWTGDAVRMGNSAHNIFVGDRRRWESNMDLEEK
jgi:hypothetical protein